MRLSSTTFTHSSTALFGLAVAGYAVLRLAGYDAPPLPGTFALPAAPIIELAPDPWQSDVEVSRLKATLGGPLTSQPDSGRDLSWTAPAGASTGVARATDPAAVPVTPRESGTQSGGTRTEGTTTTDQHDGTGGDAVTTDTAPVDTSDDSTDPSDSDDPTDPEH